MLQMHLVVGDLVDDDNPAVGVGESHQTILLGFQCCL
jgi:hypothetical protein